MNTVVSSRSLFGLVAILGAISTSHGASFFSNFDEEFPLGIRVLGNAQFSPDGGLNNSGVLKLTTIDPPAQTGSAILDELDPGAIVTGFTATFKVLIGGPSASPAFGFSFVFGQGVTGNFGVDGTGDALKIVFETFDRGNGRAPTIDVWSGTLLVASHKTPNLRTGTRFVDCLVRINEGGTLDLDYDGQTIYRNVFCYVPQAGNFGFGASTGGIADNHWIEDLDITTTTLSGPFVRAARPDYANARPDPLIQVVLDETLAPTVVDPGTIQMKLNNAIIAAPQVTQDAGLTYIAHEPTALLPAGSVNTVEVTYADSGAPPQTRSVKYDFVVTQYPTLPASFAAAAGVVDKNSSGFKVRVNQVLPPQLNTIDRAERQIAGTLKDALGQALPNIADLSLAVGDVFDLDDVINWTQTPFGTTGFFQNDSTIPGIPGTQGTDDNIAAEAITYLELAAGAYTFGVFADDGYKLTTGANPRDAFAFQLGAVDSGRGTTVFSFAVAQAGIYPFRLLYYEGQGEAGLEWFVIDRAGNRILINDRLTGGSVLAYDVANATRAFVRSVSPQPNAVGVAAATVIEVSIEDGTRTVDPGTVQLFFNDQLVNAIVNKPAGSAVTTVFYDPPGRLRSESVNTVRLAYSDTPGGGNVVQQQWTFSVIKSLSDNAPRKQDSGPDGLLVLEAENADANIAAGDTSWVFTADNPNYSGTGAMAALPNTGRNVNIDTTTAPHLDFKVEFVKTGTHYIWIRGLGDSPPGPSADDSVNVGIDGTLPATSDRIGNGWVLENGFIWANATFEDPPARFEVTTLGEHQINFWMREDGFIVDKILLTSNPLYVPGDPLTDVGPPETPRNEPPPAFQQDNSEDHLVVVEAEHAHANTPAGGTAWVLTTDSPGYGGDGAMISSPNAGRNVNIDTTAAPHLDFTVQFVVTGTHYVWIRGLGDGPPGPSADDSVNVGLDGTLPATSDRIGNGWVIDNGFVWANLTFEDPPARFEVTTLGEHQLNFWMREDGFIVDRILLTTNPEFRPGEPLTELGPPESERVPVGPPPATLSLARIAGGVRISWTNAGTLQSTDRLGGQWITTVNQANPQTVAPTGQRFYRVLTQ